MDAKKKFLLSTTSFNQHYTFLLTDLDLPAKPHCHLRGTVGWDSHIATRWLPRLPGFPLKIRWMPP